MSVDFQSIFDIILVNIFFRLWRYETCGITDSVETW